MSDRFSIVSIPKHVFYLFGDVGDMELIFVLHNLLWGVHGVAQNDKASSSNCSKSWGGGIDALGKFNLLLLLPLKLFLFYSSGLLELLGEICILILRPR